MEMELFSAKASVIAAFAAIHAAIDVAAPATFVATMTATFAIADAAVLANPATADTALLAYDADTTFPDASTSRPHCHAPRAILPNSISDFFEATAKLAT